MSTDVGQILIVEDDGVSRTLLEVALTKRGFAVTVVENAREAQEYLGGGKMGSVDCVVTDYWMPGLNGMELQTWIREQDSCLATILVTAQGEKSLITASMRGGFVDFLDKPINLPALYAAVDRAVAQTMQRRHLATADSAVQEVGRTQQQLLNAGMGQSHRNLRVHYHPHRAAGGDFFTHFETQEGEVFYLLTDVSGHDLRAAYVSAYFQGFVRGLLKRGASMEEICGEFNRFLIEELNVAQVPACRETAMETSVAICAVRLNFKARTASVMTQGAPAPRYLPPAGAPQLFGENGGSSLGWFSTLPLRRTVHPVQDGGAIYLWTDGFEDLAGRQEVSALSLARALERAQERNETLALLEAAADDVLLAVIEFSGPDSSARMWWPILAEHYGCGCAAEIDAIQAYWQRSLVLALPDFPAATIHDILLASREAVLNALIHGCAGDGRRGADYQVEYCPARKVVCVRVEDPGSGHQFDILRHEQMLESEMAADHRGLLLIKKLATEVRWERQGATIVMEFQPAA